MQVAFKRMSIRQRMLLRLTAASNSYFDRSIALSVDAQQAKKSKFRYWPALGQIPVLAGIGDLRGVEGTVGLLTDGWFCMVCVEEACFIREQYVL